MTHTIKIEKGMFDRELGIFKVDGKKIPFGSAYWLFNPKSGNKRKFFFEESTGSEWDEETEWIYKDVFGVELRVSNYVHPDAKRKYLEAKMR